jgi:hypothetical protein
MPEDLVKIYMALDLVMHIIKASPNVDKIIEEARRYCQLVVVGVMLGRFVADLRSHQAHVTSCQTRKERDLKSRWLTDLSRWRPIRKRLWMTPCTDQNRCA